MIATPLKELETAYTAAASKYSKAGQKDLAE
jgi:hypothetical protein